MAHVETYQPSGRTSRRAALVIPAASVACAILGVGEQSALESIPLLWPGVLIVLCAAAAVAVVSRWSMRFAHVRSGVAAPRYGALLGVAMILASHATAYAWSSRSDASGIFDVDRVVDFFRARVEYGWSVGPIGGGRRIAGAWVVLSWAAEATVLVYAARGGARDSVRRPYCESCHRFAVRDVETIESVDVSALRRAVRNADLEAVVAIPRASRDAGSAEYRTSRCPCCLDSVWLDVRLVAESEKGTSTDLPAAQSPGEMLVAAFVHAIASVTARDAQSLDRGRGYLLRSAALSRSLHVRLDDGV